MAMMSMRGPSTVATMMGVGAGLMYFLDPQAGRRRREFVRDQVTHSLRRTSNAFEASRRDLQNRAEGVRTGALRLLGRAN